MRTARRRFAVLLFWPFRDERCYGVIRARERNRSPLL